MRHNFSKETIKKLAERAAFICSNPSCPRLTIGPSTDGNKSIKTGVAAHICAASPDGPRYDMSQSETERKSINNGIWLCATCSVLIDKNQGLDYPAPVLRKWKKDHENLINSCLEGSINITFDALKYIQQHDERYLAKKIINELDDKGALFVDYHLEDPYFVAESLKELRTCLTSLLSQIPDESPLFIVCQSIREACRYYMNTTPKDAGIKELEFSLGAVRKIVGINVKRISETYGVRPSPQLSTIMPD
ncbi:hypothetical protein NLN92_21910 [Citrobacter portucalensis]|uniref:hypothetical protein n=1 Tax=Citrobacter portucalensis TaxID=1639133 RepID=UPI00226B667D|nr:hypothetical protein [Citrobacter portucalensis]MCX8980661.1 hypothetical protein [Citrobacter portucalensis]